MAYCNPVSEMSMEELAKTNKPALLAILSKDVFDMNGADAATVAEVAGKFLSSEEAVPSLIAILQKHPRPMAREGAILGLYFHSNFEGVTEALWSAALNDTCDEVKEAAQEMISHTL